MEHCSSVSQVVPMVDRTVAADGVGAVLPPALHPDPVQ